MFLSTSSTYTALWSQWKRNFATQSLWNPTWTRLSTKQTFSKYLQNESSHAAVGNQMVQDRVRLIWSNLSGNLEVIQYNLVMLLWEDQLRTMTNLFKDTLQSPTRDKFELLSSKLLFQYAAPSLSGLPFVLFSFLLLFFLNTVFLNSSQIIQPQNNAFLCYHH